MNLWQGVYVAQHRASCLGLSKGSNAKSSIVNAHDPFKDTERAVVFVRTLDEQNKLATLLSVLEQVRTVANGRDYTCAGLHALRAGLGPVSISRGVLWTRYKQTTAIELLKGS